MDGILPKGFPPPLYSEWDSLQGGPLLFLQGFPFSKWMRFSSRGFPLHSEWDSLQGSPLLNSDWDSHQEGHPLQENGIRTKRVTLSKANGIRFKGVPLSTAEGIRIKRVTLSKALLTPGLVAARDPFQGILLQGHATQGIPFLQRASPLYLSEWDSLQEILLLPNDNVLSRGTQILLEDGIHSELHLVRLKLRDPSRGLLPPILIHLYDKIRKLKTPLCQPQLRP